MYVVIVGAGEVGRHVARVLTAERHDVVVIDNDPAALSSVEERQDVATLLGYGASPEVLKRAGAGKADLLVAVTNHDEANLVAAITAKHQGCSRTIARLHGKEYDETELGVQYDVLGIDVVVNPQILVAQRIVRIARSHGALEDHVLAGGRIELVQLELPASSKMLDKPLSVLHLPAQTLVVAINRLGEQAVYIPGGADTLRAGDRIYVIGQTAQIKTVEDQLIGGREASRVCIVGGGVVGSAVARSLSHTDVEVKLIERNRDVAESLAAEFPRVEVIHGDGTNLTLLEEEGIGNVDLFCALSHEDEVNLMAGLLAKRVGAKQTLSIVHRPDYIGIYRQLGIDTVLSPRQEASKRVHRYVRSELRSREDLEEGQLELQELVASEGDRIVGTQLKRLMFPKNAIVGALVSKGIAKVPKGDDVVNAGDTVFVLNAPSVRDDVDRMFRKRRF